MEPPKNIEAGSQRLELSLSQREISLDQRVWPESAHLNIGGAAFLDGPLDLKRFTQALYRLVAQCDALRLAPLDDGSQLLLERFEPELECVDLSASQAPQEAMREWWQQRIQEPFQLNGLPPWRFALLHGNGQLHGLTIQFHHLVMDGWGTTQVMRRWSEIYNALESPGHAELWPEPGYREFIDEAAAYRASEAFARDAIYWETQIPSIPRILVERRYTHRMDHTLPPSRLAVHPIPRSSYRLLEQCASDLGSSPFNFFLAAIALYFARTNNYSEVVIGVPTLNRSGRRFRFTPGMFVGVTAIKVAIQPGMSVRDLLLAVGAVMRVALRHARYPVSELARTRQVIRNGRDGLFDVLLSFERQDYTLAFGSATLVQSRQLFSGISRYPLGITVCEFHQAEDLEMVLDASSACFAQGEPELLARRLWHVLEQFVASPDSSVQDVSIVPSEEQWQLLHGVNQDIVRHDLIPPYVMLFERQAALRPSATALVWNGGAMDYVTLDRRANQLAQRLRLEGAGADKIVALAIDRSAEMVVALLAVGKAGAAFLPLDTDAPTARLDDLLRESGAIALLVHQSTRARMAKLGMRAKTIDVEEIVRSSTLAIDSPFSLAPPNARDLAYVLFTSGSTGKPKGVMVEHSTLSRRLTWLSRAFAVDWRDRSAQATQLTFDPSLIELLLPLIHGASIALPPPGRLLSETLVDFVEAHGVTMMAFVPSTMQRFTNSVGNRSGLGLRVACCGGEVLHPNVAKQFMERTAARLYNVYGPTETAIFATAWQCLSDPDDTALPLGRPIDDTRIYILDPTLRPLPLGVVGEVFIGGSAIARGYLNREDLTREAFLDDPFVIGARMYRTGDRGWLSIEGDLHFCGRVDRQIKLRGYRIELGEIEAACRSVPGVLQAAAKLVERNERTTIHVWIAAASNLNSDLIQRALRLSLPDYMIPSGISVLPALTENSAGKIDYAALPEPCNVPSVVALRRPPSPLEMYLLALWEKVLKTQPIGLQDNFFDLGGDSLDAVSILAGIEQHVGRKVPMYLLTECPTLEQLAAALQAGSQRSELITPLGPDRGHIPLYLAASGNGDLMRFQNLARELGDRFDVRMLQPPLDHVIRSIPELAELYVQAITAQNLDKGFIAGFSVGGIAALETARLLQQCGQPARALVLIDTIFPHSAFGGAWSWRMLGWLVRSLHVQELSMNGRRLGAMFNDPGLVGQVMALRGYRLNQFGGAFILIKSTGLSSWDRWFFRPWRRLTATRLSEYQVPGLHGSIFEAGNVGTLAAVLARALDTPLDPEQ
jgi:syringomycin synthetase protein SyrE